MATELDSWVVKDADKEWDFHITITRDENAGRPENHADVYSAEAMIDAYAKDPNGTEEEGRQAAAWAFKACEYWSQGLWMFAVITVVPVHKKYGDRFRDATASVGVCDYGTLPKTLTEDVDTSARPYVMSAWGDDLIHEARQQANKALGRRREQRAEQVEKAARAMVKQVGGTMDSARAVASNLLNDVLGGEL